MFKLLMYTVFACFMNKVMIIKENLHSSYV